jgi:hypothetical protein
MSIEKSLSSAPMGLESLAPPEDDGIEIEIEDPESVDIHIGDLDIKIGSVEDDFDANLVDELDSDVVSQLVSELIEDFDDDVNSRKEWMQTYVDGLELLGMKIEERAEPWIGACGVYHPLLSEAVVKFQAEVMMSTFPAAGPVKTQIIGKETPEKKQAATRVAADMNYELTDVMTEFRPEHERMLWGLGLAGNAFKKVYFDPNLDRQTSIFVPAEDLVVPYGASDLQTADRITHVMRKTENEIRKLQVAGFYSDIDLGEPNNNLDDVEKKIAEKMGFRATTDDRYKILEINVNLDLEGFEDTDKDGEPTGIALPYIVTVEKGSEKCLAIRRNWNKDDKLKSKRQHFVHYGYVPGFGFYCFGLIHLVGAFAKSGTSILRQLVDAGTLANLPGGFKTRGLRVKGDDTPIGPAEWRDVDVPSGTISDNIMALPYKEPSQVLAMLLDKIVDEGRKFASAADIQVADMSANSPVGTTLAILERTLKVMTAVQARIHYSFKQELILLRDIIRDYTPPTYNYEPDEGSPKAKQSDYDLVTVIPVSDPNAATMAQKIVQYQAVIQLSQQAPDIYDLPQLHRQMLDVLGIKNAEKLVKLEEDEVPVDPVSENMNALNGKPMKAFMFQDHKAHMTVHQMFMQDPMIMQTIGQNPKANQIMAALQAHNAEHLAFEYRKQIEQQMGVPLPAPGERLPEDVEVQLSQLMAQAGQQVNQSNSAMAQQQKAQQMAQDPLIQMQQQELQLKNAEIQRKQQKDQQDMQIKSSQLQLDSMELQNKKDVEMARIQAEAARTQMQLQSTSAIAQNKMQADAERERQRTLANMYKGKK